MILVLLTEALNRHAQLEETFCKILSEKETQREKDTVDSFLELLGDILRRLSYIRRRNLQRRLMDFAITEEDEMLNEENMQ